MEDNGKYLRLFGTLFFTFIGFLVAFALLLLGIKFFFGLLSYIPYFTYVYMILILMFPTCLFLSAYIIFFRKTKYHPSKGVRVVSYIIFIAAISTWLWFFVSDLLLFSKSPKSGNGIDGYETYNLLFLAISVACLFLVGIIQALTTEKEKDWMERQKI
ncbi:MAG: hypothetical protein ABI402_19770 [Ferruginibacter sp.]